MSLAAVGSRADSLILNAMKAGKHELDAFVAHDKHDYSSTTESFFQSLLHTLPWYTNKNILKKVAAERTDVLRYHDEIEESEGSKISKLSDKRWKTNVLPHAVAEAKALGIDPRYGSSKTEFYRLHGQGETGFRAKVYDMEKYFTVGVTGDPKLYMITAPIYLTCVAFHDLRRIRGKEEHEGFQKKMMQFNYANYVYNLHQSIKYKAKVLDSLSSIK